MKKIIIVIIGIGFFSNLLGQNNIIEISKRYEISHIDLNIPNNFQIANSIGKWKNKDFNQFQYRFISADQKCLIILSDPIVYTDQDSIKMVNGRSSIPQKLYINNDSTSYFRILNGVNFDMYSGKYQHRIEIKRHLGFFRREPNIYLKEVDISSFISLYSNDSAKLKFNADSVFTYQMPYKSVAVKYSMNVDGLVSFTSNPENIFWELYPTSPQVLTLYKRTKKGEYIHMHIYCFFTREGFIQKEKYIDSLDKIIWFKE